MDMTPGKRHTAYIKPLNILLDVIALSIIGHFFLSQLVVNGFHFAIYQIICWLIIGYFSRYYDFYRYTDTGQLIYKITKQALVFSIAVIAFFLFAKHTVFNGPALAKCLGSIVLAATLFKLIAYGYIKSLAAHRANTCILAGSSPLALKLRAVYGQQLVKFFPEVQSGPVNHVIDFAGAHSVQAIFCSLAQVTQTQKEKLEAFALKTGTALKFIPDTTEEFPKNLYVDYHEDFPVLAVQKTALHNPVAAFAKRVFDIVFSLFVIVFVLSWLTPIIALFIKLESKGPVFFKQGRPGIDESEFLCYKFRSMGVNRTSEAMAVKNDMRVTKTGKFLRKTSLDELPQFINVFKGEMSVVGPRPQIWFHNNEYKKRINNFSVRLYVKPGITGLAQVSGYRGEINTDAEMQNRIRYDVFYIKQWSLLFDIRIIIQTVVNIFMGEEKAY